MVKKKTEDEAKLTDNEIVDAHVKQALRHEPLANSLGDKPDVDALIGQAVKYVRGEDFKQVQEDTAETQAAKALNKAKKLLEHVGHFETNQAIVSIDAALEWLKKCEGQRT